MKRIVAAVLGLMKSESSSGVILVLATIAALALANSPLVVHYQGLLHLPLEIRIGEAGIAKPLLLWINDGLMAVFFLLVGLELKREIVAGELSDRRKLALPLTGALGGMLVPALIYALLNRGENGVLAGWAIPTATDIAFALGALSLFGKRVPTALKVFLVSLAIFDDLGAIVIIATFYTSDLSPLALGISLLCLVPLYLLNRNGIGKLMPYLLLGLVMWVALLKSGVHATLTGVAVAMFIPLKAHRTPDRSPLLYLEHELYTAVTYGILPLFAFANAGISLHGDLLAQLLHPVPLGIALGLFLGKPAGILGFCWLGVKAGLMRLPAGADWGGLFGISLLCGIGFTMSLFIGSLAFESGEGIVLPYDERLGILAGSFFSGIAGCLVLQRMLRRGTAATP